MQIVSSIKLSLIALIATANFLLVLITTAQAQNLEPTLQIKAKLDTILVSNEPDAENPLLNIPRDIAFKPADDDSGQLQLWVVNRGAPYRIDEGTYKPNKDNICQLRYKSRKTPPENSQYWPSFTVIDDPGLKSQQANNFVDPWGIHFLAEASSIAFGTRHNSPHHHGPSEVTPDGNAYSFGTCGESRNEMKGCVNWVNNHWRTTTPLDFQGPSLWSAQPDVFAQRNVVADTHLAKSFCKGSSDAEECVRGYTHPKGGIPFTLGSHLDMLHETPMCMGIAWEQQNAYWVFDGCGGVKAQIEKDKHFVDGHGENFEISDFLLHPEFNKILPCDEYGDILRYDFRTDHGAGFDDHCDGVIERYSIGKVKRVPDVPSHMVMFNGHLFIADSGNQRIARLDPEKAGERGSYRETLGERVHEACTLVTDMQNANSDDVITTYFGNSEQAMLDTPSGLAIIPAGLIPNHSDPALVVSDFEAGTLVFISLREENGASGSGALLGHIDLNAHQLGGNTIKPMGLAIHPETKAIYVADPENQRIISVTIDS